MMEKKSQEQGSFILGIVKQFVISNISLIMVAMALCLGVASVLVTPREEEPQIVVPMADIFVSLPGASSEEVEQLAATPLERLLWQIDGVEYVYSVSSRESAVITVRFFVGEDRENSLVKLYNKINMNVDKVAPVIRSWVVKPVEIDAVPIVNIGLYSNKYNDYELRRIGEEVIARLAEVKNISGAYVVGGRKREIRAELIPEKMMSFGVSFPEVYQALESSDVSVTAGTLSRKNVEFQLTSSSFLYSAEEAGAVVVGMRNGNPVYLRDIATISDGPEEATTYSRLSFSRKYKDENPLSDGARSFPCVTLALAKKKGTNAVTVSKDILEKLAALEKDIIPDDVASIVVRNYGSTASEKVNGLLSSLLFAIVSVVLLLMVTLGWREAIVVAIAVPISFSLALFMNYLFGYTINRVTLFALILSLGLVVDDPITNVENIQRHLKAGLRDPVDSVLFAVKEVLSPVIMSTIAIIVCFTPLFFITGMMGPYMAPMAINVPLTVSFSTVSALTIVPWLTYLLLKNTVLKEDSKKENSATKKLNPLERGYRKMIGLFLDSKTKRRILTGGVIVLFIVSCLLAVTGLVPLKLLPFDNKDEFQIVIDMPEETTLEATDAVVRKFEAYLEGVDEVRSVITYTGFSSPMDFNGMVRHYYLRNSSNAADIRVYFAEKKDRTMQSHAIVLRLRDDLEKIAKENGADIKLVEVPPGPPVLSTITAEIYGDPDKTYQELISAADHVRKTMIREAFVTDTDTSAISELERIEIVIDREKAALHGVTTKAIIDSLRGAVTGLVPAQVHIEGERQSLNIRIVLPIEKRSGPVSLMQLPVKGSNGKMVPIAELVTTKKIIADQPIYHKDLKRVVFVTGEMAGRAPAEAILAMQSELKKNPVDKGINVEWAGEGEWKITLRVFRDMGIAFAVAMIGIYLILVIQSGSAFLPVLIMMAIPLTVLGIMPGFFMLNLFFADKIGQYSNPVFFTATSMIGMIALGGIVIRNSLVLVEFIQDAVKGGMTLREAIPQSGVKRLRPIVLTALTTAIGSVPITFDPVFSGLAWALIFGLTASTVFTLVIIPVAYYGIYNNASNAS
jgi:multidrug efflux pump subunit AcrB